jgi:hypothetical protein
MNNDTSKFIVLNEEGFWYHPNRSVYVNTYKRKMFSREAVEDNRLAWIREGIAEESMPDQWQFYFGTPPDEETMLDFLKDIAPSDLANLEDGEP